MINGSSYRISIIQLIIQALLSLIRLLSGLIAVDNGLEMWLLTTVDLFVWLNLLSTTTLDNI